MSADDDDMEWEMAVQAEATALLFCPSSVERSDIGTVYCDCERGHHGSHIGMMPNGSWMSWTRGFAAV